MNIAMFTNTYHPMVGGVEKSIDTLATEMRRQGHAVLIVAPESEGHSESTDEVLRVPAIKQFAGTRYSLKVFVPGDTARRIRAFRPDIVHSHQPFLLGDTALRMARELHVPLIYTNHTFMERYLHWFPVDWQILREIAEKLPVAYANLTDQVITPTESVAALLRERGTETPITSIATGIDADFFASGDRAAFRKAFGLAQGHLVIGHLGRLNPEKNLDYLARVALAFVRKSPTDRRFLLVGEGDSVPGIRALFAAHGASKQLICAGLRTGRGCADAYAAMDAFLFTSLTDTQGLVLSEAMAAGNPVFALDAPGARDMIRHKRNGYLFPSATTAPDFAAAMGSLLRDRELRARLQAAASQEARAVSIPKCTAAMLALYRSAIESVPGKAGRASPWERLVKRWDVEIDLIQEKLELLTG
jgi:glycosyltransferase involved in cell wall biosynthesis